MRYRRVIIIAAPIVALLIASAGASCDRQPGQPAVCATYLDDDGWHEEDGELMDSDPCDTDDVFEQDHRKPQPKPSVKKRP